MSDLAARLADRTERLVAIPSESGDEARILEELRGSIPERLSVVDDEDSVLLTMPARRPGAPLVLLAGHVDTVPFGEGAPGRRAGGTIHGRGAADMKGGLAVMLEIALDAARIGSDLDLGLVFFGREELPFPESALVPLFDRRPEVREAALAIVLEPTANRLELGCLGNLNATITIEGEAAHAARPWLGRNAIHAAIEALAPIAGLELADVTIHGLAYREVASVMTIEGGVAANVVPARVTARVNLRSAPGVSAEQAEGRLRDLVVHPDASIRIDGNAPSGPVPTGNELVERLRAAGDLAVGPKQAWTPVAEFGLIGVDAVNFGPGDPQYAHRDDEHVEVDALVRSYEVLRAFLARTSEANTSEEGDRKG
jgi:succinyl-diaminopimelate desuccinylase